jgi:hypothetical protein
MFIIEDFSEARVLLHCVHSLPETAMGTSIYAQDDSDSDYVKAVYE